MGALALITYGSIVGMLSSRDKNKRLDKLEEAIRATTQSTGAASAMAPSAEGHPASEGAGPAAPTSRGYSNAHDFLSSAPDRFEDATDFAHHHNDPPGQCHIYFGGHHHYFLEADGEWRAAE